MGFGVQKLRYMAAERTNHYCQLCYKTKKYQEGKRKGKGVKNKSSTVYCSFCQHVLCTECWEH